MLICLNEFMQLHQLKPSKRKRKKRIGRGGSHGTFATRGAKGQKSRSGGGGKGKNFEGTTNTLFRRTPKARGFKSIHKKNDVVNVFQLDNSFQDGDIVSPQTLVKKRLLKNARSAVKILGDGELNKKLVVSGCAVSKSAEEKIKKAGGEIMAHINI